MKQVKHPQDHQRNPDYETFNLAEHTIYELRTSRIKPGFVQSIEVGIRCPRCEAQVELLEHGYATNCPKCNLYMEAWGNALVCRVE